MANQTVTTVVNYDDAAAAVLREIYNVRRGGRFDWQDIAWTLAGGAVLLTAAACAR